MKKETSPKKHAHPRDSRAHTHVRTDDELSVVLAEIISSKSRERLLQLQETLAAIQGQFDHRSVTMTSTNIPDSLVKLSSVLVETSEAAAKVFRLVERQQHFLEQSERVLGELERKAQGGNLTTESVAGLLATCRAVHNGLRATAHEIVLAQEFQDVTGQKIRKVSKVVAEVDSTLCSLLRQLKVEVPERRPSEEPVEDKDIDQASADALLKELGV